MDDPHQIWQDLRLDQLISDGIGKHNEIVPLKVRETLESSKQSASKIILGHKKTWKKPSHAILRERYGSNPHDPPVLNPGKLERLADPLRGKFSAYDELMSEDEGRDEVIDYRNRRYDLGSNKAFPVTASPSSSSRRTNHQNADRPEMRSLASATDRASVSPSKGGRNKSAFFLTAAGSDDDDEAGAANLNRSGFGASRFAASQGRGGPSRLRGRLDEARRLGAVKPDKSEKLSQSVLNNRKATGRAAAPGTRRKIVGNGRAPAATGPGARRPMNTNIKSSIPQQQPPPKRRPKEAPFGVSTTKPPARRGVAGTGPVGVGLDMSGLSANNERDARRRNVRAATIAATSGSNAARSQCTMDIASGNGARAAGRIRAGRSLSGPNGAAVKSAPALLGGRERAAGPVSNRPPARAAGAIPISGVSDRENGKERGGAASSGYGQSNVGSAVRQKRVTIDPSLSPLKKSGSAGGAGLWRNVGRSTRDEPSLSSPRGARPSSRDIFDNNGVLNKTSGPAPPAPSSAPVDVDAIRTTLDRIQAKEAERAAAIKAAGGGSMAHTGLAAGGLTSASASAKTKTGGPPLASRGGPVARLGVPLPAESSAALLAQHAKRLSAHLIQARTLASQYGEESDLDAFSGADVSAFLPSRKARPETTNVAETITESKVCV